MMITDTDNNQLNYRKIRIPPEPLNFSIIQLMMYNMALLGHRFSNERWVGGALNHLPLLFCKSVYFLNIDILAVTYFFYSFNIIVLLTAFVMHLYKYQHIFLFLFLHTSYGLKIFTYLLLYFLHTCMNIRTFLFLFSHTFPSEIFYNMHTYLHVCKLLKGAVLKQPHTDSGRVVQYLLTYKIASVKVKYSLATNVWKYQVEVRMRRASSYIREMCSSIF